MARREAFSRWLSSTAARKTKQELNQAKVKVGVWSIYKIIAARCTVTINFTTVNIMTILPFVLILWLFNLSFASLRLKINFQSCTHPIFYTCRHSNLYTFSFLNSFDWFFRAWAIYMEYAVIWRPAWCRRHVLCHRMRVIIAWRCFLLSQQDHTSHASSSPDNWPSGRSWRYESSSSNFQWCCHPVPTPNNGFTVFTSWTPNVAS